MNESILAVRNSTVGCCFFSFFIFMKREREREKKKKKERKEKKNGEYNEAEAKHIG